MVASLLAFISQSNLPFPRASVLLSPYIDLTFSYDSITSLAEYDAVVSSQEAKANASHIFHGRSYGPLEVPAMKPVSRAEDWPEVLVMTGSHEVLLDDSRAYVSKLRDSGVNVRYIEQDAMSHVYPFFWQWMPEADHGLRFMCGWIWSRVGM